MMRGSSDLHPPGAALLRVGNASIWLTTGLLVLAPSYRAIGEAQLDALGLPNLLMWVTCAAEVVLALVIATRAPGWLLTLLPTAMIAAFTLILALHDPLLLAHPLGVLSKNLPVLALIWVSFEVHRSGWTPRATRWLRVGMAIVWITEGLFPKLLFQQAWEVELVGSYVRPIDPATFLRVVGALQIVSGVLALTLRGNWLRVLLAGQFVALLVLPTLVGLREPHWFTHPFGPLTKNLPILAGTALALARVPSSPFFRAEWRRVCMFHFRVPRALGARHLPPGVELDEHDGSAWVSFVSLEFERTRVLGIAVAWHTRFGDVNLRLYVGCARGPRGDARRRLPRALRRRLGSRARIRPSLAHVRGGIGSGALLARRRVASEAPRPTLRTPTRCSARRGPPCRGTEPRSSPVTLRTVSPHTRISGALALALVLLGGCAGETHGAPAQAAASREAAPDLRGLRVLLAAHGALRFDAAAQARGCPADQTLREYVAMLAQRGEEREAPDDVLRFSGGCVEAVPTAEQLPLDPPIDAAYWPCRIDAYVSDAAGESPWHYALRLRVGKRDSAPDLQTLACPGL